MFRAWLAGFIAGEGYFGIFIRKKPAGRRYFMCQFSLGLRADDLPVLLGLQRKTGLGRVLPYAKGSSAERHPAYRWIVNSKRDCWALVQLLDGISLYGKKQRDYDLWRQAVALWVRGRRAQGVFSSTVPVLAIETIATELVRRHQYNPWLAISSYDPFAQPHPTPEPIEWPTVDSCRRGHPYDPTNTRYKAGGRYCRQCERERMAAARKAGRAP